MKCERCGHCDAIQYSLCLVNTDGSSYEEGSHVGDVDVRLCSECEAEVADELLEIKSRIVGKHAGATEIGGRYDDVS